MAETFSLPPTNIVPRLTVLGNGLPRPTINPLSIRRLFPGDFDGFIALSGPEQYTEFANTPEAGRIKTTREKTELDLRIPLIELGLSSVLPSFTVAAKNDHRVKKFLGMMVGRTDASESLAVEGGGPFMTILSAYATVAGRRNLGRYDNPASTMEHSLHVTVPTALRSNRTFLGPLGEIARSNILPDGELDPAAANNPMVGSFIFRARTKSNTLPEQIAREQDVLTYLFNEQDAAAAVKSAYGAPQGAIEELFAMYVEPETSGSEAAEDILSSIDMAGALRAMQRAIATIPPRFS